MVEYNKVNIELSDSQLNKFNQTGVTFKMFEGNNSPHELLLTTRQKTKLRNAFEKIVLTIINLSKLIYLK